jgi:hypothetical protein
VRIRSVTEEYEARLAPTAASPQPAASGKAEWKTYRGGARQGRATVSGLDLPDGTVLELAVASRTVARLTVQQGRARYRRETERAEDVPWVETDQVVQLLHGGHVLLEGRFRPE